MTFYPRVQRREFLKLAGSAAVAAVTENAFAAPNARVQIVVDAADPVTASQPASWALKQLRRALSEKNVESEVIASTGQAKNSNLIVVLSNAASETAKGFAAPQHPLEHPESTRIVPGYVAGIEALLVSASGPLGMVYGLLELTDRVECSSDASLGLHLASTIEESPANQVRSAARAFCSEIEDKAWYYDKNFWRGYLDMLAKSRFNRFNFALGFGYDFPRGVTGDYFHYPYPYLVDVPSYNVRVVPLAPGERARNLEMLQFIASETALRGLHFQLGIWTHAYEWTSSPNADHRIEGLTPETHAAYSRDALAMLLKLCPEIQGLTFRVHGESGIPEGSYPFWQTLFDAIAGCGRKVEIDMHAKGINQIMIDMAAKTGMPVKVSAKSWAEHMGLGYHQADIRELEIPRPDRMETGLFAVSNGERRFTRYGYADLFQQGQKFDVLFRLWPGTQRHLLWGDPEMAAAYGRTAHFCNASGLEICEPLTFKGREGSGIAGGRCAYLDKTLEPGTSDWAKFDYTYRVWGRLLYKPDSSPEVWQRYLKKQFGSAAPSAETALMNASRILPLITTAHLPSASNHSFWPEIYDNMPIVIGSEKSPYSDTPTPNRFGTVSPLDPQIFSSIIEYANESLDGHASAKYSPIEVAQWLEDFGKNSTSALETTRQQGTNASNPDFRRWEEDILIQAGIGSFFAAKLRSGLLFEIYLKTGSTEAGQLALAKYTEARQAWALMAKRAAGVYLSDITYGAIPQRRGNWSDRLPNIDLDLEAMRATLLKASSSAPEVASKSRVDHAIQLANGRPNRPSVACSHKEPIKFAPGEPLTLSLQVSVAAPQAHVSSVDLYYRHVNQGERWRSIPMDQKARDYEAAIPGDYTHSVYPLQYYFVLHHGGDSASFHPAFSSTFSNQPYYAVWQRRA